LLTLDNVVSGHDDVEISEILFPFALATVPIAYQNIWRLGVICVEEIPQMLLPLVQETCWYND
jgi:hypothetical protein